MTGKPQSYATNGDYARLLREQLGISQAVFAERCGLSERTIRDIETGRGASAPTLQRVAEKSRLSSWHDLLTSEERSRFPGEPAAIVVNPVATDARSSPVNRLFQLPAVVADFTGREDEFEQIVELFRGDGGRAGLSALRGMGGVGKTSLALKVAHAVKNQFPDAQLILNLQGTADRPVTPVEAMARVIRGFHPDAAKLPDSADELLPLYLSVLAGKRALVVLDNAKDEEQVRLLVTAPSPTGFILTSRKTLELDGVKSILLDVLSIDEALRLLREIVAAKGMDDELRSVAGLCGRLPLALRVAGDFLRLHPNWTFDRYIEALKDENTRLERLKGKTKEKDVEAVLGLSARQLVLENEKLAERWQMLSVFPADFDDFAAAAMWDLKSSDEFDKGAALDELTHLLDRSLLQYDEQAERYSLHDLMRPIARATFTYVENHQLLANSAHRLRDSVRRFAEHYQHLLDAMGTLYSKGGNAQLAALAGFDIEYGNIIYGQAWAAKERNTDTVAAQLCLSYVSQVYVINLRLSTSELISWHLAALSVVQADDPESSRIRGALYGNLGNYYVDQNDLHLAAAQFRKQLEIAQIASDPREEAKAIGNLGLIHRRTGNAAKAVENYERWMSIASQHGDKRDESKACGNIGNVYAELGDFEKAYDYHIRALRLAEASGELREVCRCLGNIAWLHYEGGSEVRACQLAEKAVELARVIGESRQLGHWSWVWALSLAELGQIEEAISRGEEALRIFESIHDPRVEEMRCLLTEWCGQAPPAPPG